MAKEYRYINDINLISPGYPGEEVTVVPATGSNPVTTSATSGSVTYTYTYRDSTISSNNNSSRVAISVTDSWTATTNEVTNDLTISLTTTINSIIRDDLRPGAGQVTAGNRAIFIRRTQNGSNILSWQTDPIGTAHTILTNAPYNMGTESFILQPGQGANRSSFYLYNYVSGHVDDPDPVYKPDILGVGTRFYNILPEPPKDYRPGETWNGTAYMSHNRSNGGVCSYWDGSKWAEMRTDDAGVGTDNPPLCYHDGKYFNQYKLGKDADT